MALPRNILCAMVTAAFDEIGGGHNLSESDMETVIEVAFAKYVELTRHKDAGSTVRKRVS